MTGYILDVFSFPLLLPQQGADKVHGQGVLYFGIIDILGDLK